MGKKIILCALLQALIVISLFAEKFEFLYTTGHEYTLQSTINQKVYVNNVKSHDAKIINDIAVKEVEAQSNGSANIESTYKTSEVATFTSGLSQNFTTDYVSKFIRDSLGNYILDENAFTPVVRNVPVFPDRDIEVGETWTAEGSEFHDFRENFGIVYPFQIPFIANYKYERTEVINNRVFHVISISYELNYKTPSNQSINENTPMLTKASVKQILYWDTQKGYFDKYTENHDVVIETTLGDVVHIVGDAQVNVINFAPRLIDKALSDIRAQIDTLDTENIKAHTSPEGITLTIEDIQFEANSAILSRSAQNQLQQVNLLLESLPRNDLLITGHTALAGTESGQKVISEQRAQAVAEYLASIGVRSIEEMQTVGAGASEPLAPNTSEENMAKNRRVEITVLNN